MRYTVLWSPDSLNKLAEIWIRSGDREAISRSSQQIERTLRDDPEEAGEEYYGDRLLIVGALAVGYRVLEDDRIVDIFDVWSS